MKGYAVQEFNNVLFDSELYPANAPVPAGSNARSGKDIAYWESPRLTTEYPIEGRPAGSDRGICKIVNGLVAVKFLDKQLIEYSGRLEISAGLYGEYAGISGIMDQISFSQFYTPFFTQMYASNGAIAFPQLSNFANLAQNIFIRVVFRRIDSDLNLVSLPLKLRISGSLIATAPR
jgi:hypothetical protein